MYQVDRVDDLIKRMGSTTALECTYFANISNASARISEAMKKYPIKRVHVKKTEPNSYNEYPDYYRYYYNRDEIIFEHNEEILEWLDELPNEHSA